MAAPPPANATKDEQRIPQLSRLEQDEEPGPDVSVLKEIGRKALIDSLNSVRFSWISTVLGRAEGLILRYFFPRSMAQRHSC